MSNITFENSIDVIKKSNNVNKNIRVSDEIRNKIVRNIVKNSNTNNQIFENDIINDNLLNSKTQNIHTKVKFNTCRSN